VARDQPLLIDWGALVKGYCSDLTRTLMVGRVSPKMKQIYKVVFDAQQGGDQVPAAGVTDDFGRIASRADVIDACGLRKVLRTRLGHGIGRDITSSRPCARPAAEEELARG
jgi:Xaa-Pro aminopeptidase